MHARNGFSLVEVLVASLLIMLGVTGYVTLQSEYVIASANINLRIVALYLAQQKLIDLAYFQQLSASNENISYQSIETNLGGSIAAGERDVILSSKLNFQTYNIQWQVENAYYVDTNFDAMADSWVKIGEPFFPIDLPRYANLKNIRIIISWVNINGSNKQLEMFGSIAPIAQSQSFQTKYRLPSTLATP
jgi:hypothetical protein